MRVVVGSPILLLLRGRVMLSLLGRSVLLRRRRRRICSLGLLVGGVELLVGFLVFVVFVPFVGGVGEHGGWVGGLSWVL